MQTPGFTAYKNGPLQRKRPIKKGISITRIYITTSNFLKGWLFKKILEKSFKNSRVKEYLKNQKKIKLIVKLIV